MPKNPKYTVDFQYQKYLDTVGLTEANMHPEQKRQLKMTFYAAFLHVMTLLRDDVSTYPEDKAVEILEDMESEIKKFFVNNSRQN